MKYLMKTFNLATLLLMVVLVGCSAGGGGGSSNGGGGGGGGNIPNIPFTPSTQFGVYNNCSFPVWVQATNQPIQDKEITEIQSKQGYSYHITGQSVPAFTVIPKTGCDASGNNCEVGQSLPPCPSDQYGCQPPIDSRFEATFNSTSGTFFDVSAVDGFTLPYAVTTKKSPNETNPACVNANASKLNPANCPTTEDLSTPRSIMDPSFGSFAFGDFTNPNGGGSLTSEDLRVFNPRDGKVIGCAAPHKKLINPAVWGGLAIGQNAAGYNPDLYSQVIMYSAAPTSGQLIAGGMPGLPPAPNNQGFLNMSNYCKSPTGPCTTTGMNPQGLGATDTFKAGPITRSQWVQYIHDNTEDIYAWAYDDGTGTRVCSSSGSKITFILCP